MTTKKRYICKKNYLECIKGKNYDVIIYSNIIFAVHVSDSELSPGEFFVYDIFEPNFSDHFNTIQEERKLKLENISKI